jgi:hypothetical protein
MMNMHSLARLHSGGRLHALEEEFERHRIKTASLKHGRSRVNQDLLCQLVAGLRAPAAAARRLAGPIYDLEEISLGEKHGSLHETALAQERAARCYLPDFFILENPLVIRALSRMDPCSNALP